MSTEWNAITILGRHSADWMQALDENAPVWSLIPSVRSVRVLEPVKDKDRIDPEAANGRPVLIPLLETHIRSRPRGYFALCPDPHTLETLADKKRFASYINEAKLQHLCPHLYEKFEIDKSPLVAKPRNLYAGLGIRVLHNEIDYLELHNLPIWSPSNYLFQEFIDIPVDYCAYLFCLNGEILWHRSYRYHLDMRSPIRGPVTQVGQPYETESRHLEDILRILKPLHYSGPCNVDYKIRRDGSICILEINPRLGGSLIKPENTIDLSQVISLIIEFSSYESR